DFDAQATDRGNLFLCLGRERPAGALVALEHAPSHAACEGDLGEPSCRRWGEAVERRFDAACPKAVLEPGIGHGDVGSPAEHATERELGAWLDEAPVTTEVRRVARVPEVPGLSGHQARTGDVYPEDIGAAARVAGRDPGR